MTVTLTDIRYLHQASNFENSFPACARIAKSLVLTMNYFKVFRCPAMVASLIPLAMNLSLGAEDSEREWVAGAFSEECSQEEYLVGEEAIERVAFSLGGRVMIAPVLAGIEAFSTSPDPLHRRAAVAALARLAEGCTKDFLKVITTSMAFLNTALQDASPRVQYEAAQAVGQMSLLFPDAIEGLMNAFANID